MPSPDHALIVRLREKTGAGILACKSALEEAGGDMAVAERILRERGVLKAAQKSARATGHGLVYAYVHLDKIGVLVELNCETDFVARTPEFKALAHEIALQVAAADPHYVSEEEIPPDILEEERALARAEEQGTPPESIEEAVQGKMKKYFSEVCLLPQPFFKDETLTIAALIQEKVATLGENIRVRRFCRFALGA